MTINATDDDNTPKGGSFSPEVTKVKINDELLEFTYHDPRIEVLSAFENMSEPLRRDVLTRATSLAMDMIISGRSSVAHTTLEQMMDLKGENIILLFEGWAQNFINNELTNTGEGIEEQLTLIFQTFLGDESGFNSLLTELPDGLKTAINEAFDPAIPTSAASRMIHEFGTQVEASTELANNLSSMFNPNDELL